MFNSISKVMLVQSALAARDEARLCALVASGIDLEETFMYCEGESQYAYPSGITPGFHQVEAEYIRSSMAGGTNGCSMHPSSRPEAGTHLVVAIRRGSPEQVALLIKAGVKVNTPFKGWTPLEHLTLQLSTIPAQNAHQIIQLLLAAGSTPSTNQSAILEAMYPSECFALAMAIHRGDKTAALLIANATTPALFLETLRVRQQDSKHPLNWLSVHADARKDILRHLETIAYNYHKAQRLFQELQHDTYLPVLLIIANISFFGPYKDPAKHLGIVMDLLLEFAAYAIQTDLRAACRFVKACECRLILATRKNDVAKVHALLQNLVNLNTRDWNGLTALEYANLHGFHEIRQLICTAPNAPLTLRAMGLFQPNAAPYQQASAVSTPSNQPPSAMMRLP